MVGREDGVEDVVDFAVEDEERAALEEGHSAGFEGGEIEGLGEDEVLVGEDGKRQMEAFGGFVLIVGGLGRESEEMVDAEVFEFGEVVAERAGLGGTAPSARDEVPSVRVFDAGLSGSRVGVDDG